MIETQIEAFCLHNTTTFPSLNLLTFPNLSGFHKALPLPVLSASLWHCRPIAWKLLLLFLMKRERGRCDQNSQKAMHPCQTCKADGLVSTSVFVQSQNNAGPVISVPLPRATHLCLTLCKSLWNVQREPYLPPIQRLKYQELTSETATQRLPGFAVICL